MSTTANIQIQVVVTSSDGSESDTVTQSFQIPPAATQKLIVAVTAGRSQVFLPGPPTMSMALIVPPNNSTIAKTWDAPSTVGGQIGTALPSLIGLPSGSTSFNIGSAGSETLTVYVW